MNNRIKYLLLLACAPAFLTSGALAAPSECSPAFTEIRVTDYGAVPDDGKDDSAAVLAALKACRKAKSPCLVFPSGKYHFLSPSSQKQAHIEVNDFPEINVRGENAELIGSGLISLMQFQRCASVRVTGIDVDWNEVPFAGGRVIATGGDYIDVKIAAPHPLREVPVQAIQTYDITRRAALASSQEDYYLLAQKAYKKNAEIISSGVLRIYKSPSPEILRAKREGRTLPLVGNHIIIWYVLRGGSAIRLLSCGDAVVEKCRVFCIPGMGITSNSCDSVALRGCEVAPRPGGGMWMSSTVDGSHFNMIRDSVEITDCRFEGMGDDGGNVHGMYSMVHERPDDRTIVLRGWKNIYTNPDLMKRYNAGLPMINDLGPPARNSINKGETLEFSKQDNPLVPVFSAKIVNVKLDKVNDVMVKRVTVDRDLPAFVTAGSIVGNASEAPRLFMKNTVVRGNRGGGLRLSTRDALVEDCVFENMTGAGIWILCDSSVSYESIATRNVTIRNNVFSGPEIAILVTAGRKQPYPDVHENLTIEGNRITTTRDVAMDIQSTRRAVVRGNIIKAAGENPIRVSLSSDVSIDAK